MWSVVDEAERASWVYTPLVSVGALRFGMSHEQVVTAMDATGFTCRTLPPERQIGVLSLRAEFRATDAPKWSNAVTVHYRDPGILAAVAVDARHGPQVLLDGIPLVAQVPSELTERIFGYVTERGWDRTISVEGDASSDELGYMVRAQRAGDVLLSRAFFAKFDDCAHTLHDCVPTSEWQVR